MNLFSALFPASQSGDSKSVQFGYSTEFHNHLLPGIDDGVDTVEESIEIIKKLYQGGIRKIITTPHIKTEIYNNTPEIILGKLAEVKAELKSRGIDIAFEAAAEYFIDETFLNKVKKEEPILTFGGKYLLMETSHSEASVLLTETVFQLKLQGYKPIFAHPERYQYAFHDFSLLERLYDSGLYFQLNINSIIGYYGKEPQRQAKLLIEKGMVDFVGSDTHGMAHVEMLQKSVATKEFQTLLAKGKLMNHLL